MKTIVITGATGLVGSHLIERLAGEYRIIAAGRDKARLEKRYTDRQQIICLSNEELLAAPAVLDEADCLIHCAFTRSNAPDQVAAALHLTQEVFRLAKGFPRMSILHISTRSVYQEPAEGTLNTEDSPIVPSGAIGIAKYAGELMLELMCEGTDRAFAQLRLASVNEIKKEDVMVRPINVFVDRMLAHEPIRVIGGMQVMSYVAPQDVADAVAAVLALPTERWERIYNVGTAWKGTMTLLKIAETVREIGEKQFGLAPVDINVEPKDVQMHAGLDITRIHEATGWEPKYGIREMIEAVYRLKLER